MSDNSDDFVPSLCVAVDVKGYSNSPDELRQREIQGDLISVLTEAAGAAGLDRGSWNIQPQGDGELAVLPISNKQVQAVIDRYLPRLAALLLLHNVHRSDTQRLRLRLAVGDGRVGEAPNGYAGNAVISASRLLDSRPLRDVLEADRTVDLAVILSDDVHRHFVAAGHTKLTTDRLRLVSVQVKNFRARAWLWAPGGDVTRPARPWMRRGALAAAVAVVLAGGVIGWSVIAAPQRGRAADGLSASFRDVTLTSGDHLDVVRGLAGTGLADADLDLHPRYRPADAFEVSPWGAARLAKSATPATRASCQRTLAQRTDVILILTQRGAADGGDLGIGGWMCLRVDASTTAGLRVVRLDQGLPGRVELAVSVWKQ